MRISIFTGQTLDEYVKSAKLVGSRKLKDGREVGVYRTEVEGPIYCPFLSCVEQSVKMRHNGSYPREVVEGLVALVLLISRWRCGLCGHTVSCLFDFLIPYRRFTAKIVCLGVEQYAQEATSYEQVSIDLSVFEDVCEEGQVEGDRKKEVSAIGGKDGYCPAKSTVFGWVDFLCKRIGRLVQQVEKELVLVQFDVAEIRGESKFTNLNSVKACVSLERYPKQKSKKEELNRLTYFHYLAGLLVGGSNLFENLRAHFSCRAEKCFDLLSDVIKGFPRAQTCEQALR